MKRFILTIALLSSALVAGAANFHEEVLRSVETNNKELQANPSDGDGTKVGSQTGQQPA